MATTTFVNGTTTSDEDWFNDVDRLHYDIFGDPADSGEVIQALSYSVDSKSANYPIVLTDANHVLVHAAADDNPRTFTIPANASVAFPVGTVLIFVNLINTLTIDITTDTMILAVTGSTGSRTIDANGVATALKVASTTWIISGSGLS